MMTNINLCHLLLFTILLPGCGTIQTKAIRENVFSRVQTSANKQSSRSSEDARRKLQLQGISFDETTFLDRVRKNDKSAVELFLLAGINPNSKLDNTTALIFAVILADAEMINLLLAHGADVSLRDWQGNTALMFAAGQGKADIVRALLSKAANASEKNSRGETPLMQAARSGDASTVKLLLEQKVDINAEDEARRNALVHAVESGHVEIAELLKAVGVKETQETALMIAIATNDIGGVKGLLEKGANPDEEGTLGWTPLLQAAREGQTEIVEALLIKGAKSNVRDRLYGDTALMQAAAKGHLASVRLLLKYGADVNTKNEQGRTALMYAAWFGHLDVVKEMLNKGADAKIRSKEGETAANLAEKHGHTEIVELLRK